MDCAAFSFRVKRRNVQEAFVGEPTGDPTQSLDNYAEGDEAVDIGVRRARVQLLVPAGYCAIAFCEGDRLSPVWRRPKGRSV
jgi:hypothetical protein